MLPRERRSCPRERLRVPVLWAGGARGWTRDVSPQGVFVYVRWRGPVPPWCALEIGFSPARLRLRAIAQVTRVEPGPAVTGIAMRLLRLRLRAMR